MSNYLGASQEQYYMQNGKRFFYGLRRTDNGELFMSKVEEGQEFFEGRDYNHNLVYANLNYEQFKHDDRDIFYYVNSEGELCIRVNEDHTYDDGSSSSGEAVY